MSKIKTLLLSEQPKRPMYTVWIEGYQNSTDGINYIMNGVIILKGSKDFDGPEKVISIINKSREAMSMSKLMQADFLFIR